jgi:predicted DNA binding CopG/RHH family protein
MDGKARPMPRFASEAEERRFLAQPRLDGICGLGQAERVRMPKLRASTTSISLRLPVSLLERIKVAAHKRDVPYQSLIKTWLAEKV